jgi:ethanolamine utilization protein EutP (predicted NTPase)
MEVFKIWLGDYGLIARQNCPDFNLSSTEKRPKLIPNGLFSVNKVDIEMRGIGLVDCCLTKAEAEAIFEAATLNENPVAKVTK